MTVDLTTQILHALDQHQTIADTRKVLLASDGAPVDAMTVLGALKSLASREVRWHPCLCIISAVVEK
jgi:siroheme synthase